MTTGRLVVRRRLGAAIVGALVAVGVMIGTLTGALAGPGVTISGTAVVVTAGTEFTGTVGSSSGIVGEVAIDFGDSTNTSVTPEPDGSIVVTHTWAEGSYDLTISASGVTAHTIVDALVTPPGAFDIEPVAPGGTGTASTSGVTATLTNPSSDGALMVGVYSHNPTGSALPLAMMFVDVFAFGAGAGTTVEVTLTIPAGSPPLDQLTLYFFDPDAGQFLPVQAPTTLDVAGNQITITLGASTLPSVTQLTGTVFGVAGAAASPVVAAPQTTG